MLREHQRICEKALTLLEARPFIMVANLGEQVRDLLGQGEKLRSILAQCDKIEFIQDPDPEKRERVAICKKDNHDAKKLFFSKYASGSKEEINIIRSILYAFTQHVEDNKKLIISNKFPYKFKIIDHESGHDGWISVSKDLLIDKNGDFQSLSSSEFDSLVEKIKRWASENDIEFNSLIVKTREKKSYSQTEDGLTAQSVLLDFIKIQPVDIQHRIIFTSDFIRLLFDRQ